MASTSSSAVPRTSTDDDRATLLAPPARDDDAESNTSSIRVNRRYRNRRSSNIEDDDFDRRSIIDILKQPRLLTTLEQGLVILAIVLLCLAAIFGGLALGLKHRVDEGGDDGNGNGNGDGSHGGEDTGPIYRTTTLTTTQTQTQTTTVAAPAPTGLPPQDPPSKNEEVCLTPTCVQISAAILDSIDESVDPCEDFYQFANGNWLAAHPIPPEKGLYGAAQWIDQRNKDLLLRILGTPIDELLDRPALATSGVTETGSGLDKDEEREADRKNLVDLHTFYSSCMDEDALDRRGAEPLLEVVREVIAAWHGNPEAVGDAGAGRKQDRIKRLTDTLALLHAKGIDALFSSYTQGDYRTAPDSMRLWLSQGGIGLPNPEYYADKAVEKVYTEVIRSALSSVYSQLDDGKHLLDIDDEDLSITKKKGKKGKKGGKGKSKHPAPAPPTHDFSAIFDFETRLSSVFVDSVTLEDPVRAYNAYNLSELQHSLAPFIDWSDYFSSFSPRAFPHPVIVDAPAFIGNLSKIIEKTSDETLEVYFVWKTVQSLASLIGPRERARKEVTQLHNYLSGIDEGVRGRREDVCLQSLLDNYGFLMGRYYVQQAFNGDAKEYAETIIKSAIQAFKDRLQELDWLDDSSRAGAEEKASAIGIKIGYPTAAPDTRSAVALRRHYAGVPSPAKGRYFEAVMDVRTQDERRKWLGVGKAREGWEMVPTEVNAYYQPQANEMVFPAGILQAPYFSKDYPEYLGFGSMASLAGHELTHAFDSAGRQFDKTGKLTDWWTNDTIARYNDLTECIVEQYGEYYMVGPDGRKYHVNSRFTLGEDIADGGGLAQTYRAWSDRFASDPSGEKHDNYILPGLNYTREQLFFIQFARGWARNIKPAEAVRRIRTDEHSPTKFRVIGPLSNSEEFQKAFQCTKKSKMNRKNKCKIW